MEWNKLSMADRAKYIALGVQNGVISLNTIREAYNKYAMGGHIYDGTTEATQQMGRPRAYARRAGEIQMEYRDPEIDYEKHKNQAIYVDEAGRPISDDATKTHDVSNITWWKPSLKSTGQTQLEKADERMVEKARADEYAKQFSAPAILGSLGSGMNFLSPSQQFGAIVDWAQGEKGYWEGIGGTNSGFFTDKFAEEHPYWTLAGNIVGDGVLGLAGLDAIELATTGTSKLTSLPRLLRANMPRKLPRGQNYRYRVVSDLENPGDAQRAIDNANTTGTISSNPEGTWVANGEREHYIGPYFSSQLPPMDKTSKVIVGSTADPNIQWMEIAPHETKFRMTKGTSQYTPLYNGVPNTAPTSSFKYYTRGNNFLTRKFWFENNFQPADLPDVGLFNYGKGSNNMVHMDFGDYKGFTDNGAYIKDNTLFPGTPPEGQRPFIWFNKGKPYTEGINGSKYTRAFVADAENISGIEQVRKMTEPVGQWTGSKGLVLKSEYVTPDPIDLELSKGILFNIDPVTGRVTIAN